MVESHGNCIGGERRPAEAGGSFEVAAPIAPNQAGDPSGTRGRRPSVGGAPRKSARAEAPQALGTWPRSGASDVRAAIAAASAAQAGWATLRAGTRRDLLARAVRDLCADPDPGGLLAARLALDLDEIASHFAPLPALLERALRDPHEPFMSARIDSGGGGGLFLLAPSWAELLGPPAAALFAALCLGRTALVLSDPRAPMIADSLAAALERAALPAGVLAVLHGDGEDVLRAALASGAPTYVLASAFPARARRLQRLASGLAGPDFGAGLGGAGGPGIDGAPPFDLRVLRSRSVIVRSSDDPAERAAAVVEGSFGRKESLSGQLPGQIARVLCHERSFSRFTEQLFAALSRSPDVARPAPLVDREAEDHLRRARVLGLDEGATLIFDGDSLGAAPARLGGPGGEPAEKPLEPAQSESAPSVVLSTDDAILAPTVFTNVEERMRLAHLARPAPLLCLLRVQTDERALALAPRLDLGAAAEDLSLEPTE